MASTSFRESMNSLGWSRRVDLPANTNQNNGLLSSLKSLRLFRDNGYSPLPTTESTATPSTSRNQYREEDSWLTLSRSDRLMIFGGCNFAALCCFVTCFALWPIMMAKPRKFAILWSLGSSLFLFSWAAMMGPWAYASHLMSSSRLPFTLAYFGSILLTLYFSLGLQNTILTLFSSLIQLTCLVWYLVSYFPMGSTGLRYAASFGTQRATAWMTSS